MVRLKKGDFASKKMYVCSWEIYWAFAEVVEMEDEWLVYWQKKKGREKGADSGFMYNH